MADMQQAIQVTTDVEIDWSEFGRIFAEQKSDGQAAFILGFHEAIADMQLAFIGSDAQFDAHPTLRREVSDVLDALAFHVRGGEKL